MIDERLDLDLLAAAAAARPDWSFVMIGPVVKVDPVRLPRAANLHWLGPRDYDALPAYLAGWDVALMPFALNEAMRFISPTKTPEHLAAETVAPLWRMLCDEVLAERPPAPALRLFHSFLQGGRECSSHRLGSGRRLGLIESTDHDANVAADYRQLGGLGVRALRDGLRWHRIEARPGGHDFASWRLMLAAAEATRRWRPRGASPRGHGENPAAGGPPPIPDRAADRPPGVGV